MDSQDRVATFVDERDVDAEPAYRVLDLAAETGEIAADPAKSSDYGDALFSLLATAESLDIDAGAALDGSLAKYERRVDESGDPGSK